MESVGEYLRRERTLRGVPLSRIHEATRIPLKTLEALEKDDFDGLPHPTFIKGFIKTYCKELGLDETDAVLRYELHLKEAIEEEEGGHEAKPERAVPKGQEVLEQPAAGSRKALLLVAGGVLIIIAFYVVGSIIRSGETPVHVASEQSHPVNQELGPLEPAGGGADSAPVKKPAAPLPGKHTLSVHVAEETWIEVSIDGGKPIEVLLKGGENISWEARDAISIVVGNAGGVKIVFDGVAVPVSGKPGEVLRLKFPS